MIRERSRPDPCPPRRIRLEFYSSAGLDFARTNGARIINTSLDSPTYSQALSNALFSMRESGIIVVASAGNNAADIDLNPRYPACYDIDSIVSVAYTTRTDSLGSLSNFGATNVDLAAPGAAMSQLGNCHPAATR